MISGEPSSSGVEGLLRGWTLMEEEMPELSLVVLVDESSGGEVVMEGLEEEEGTGRTRTRWEGWERGRTIRGGIKGHRREAR